ncbi:hypothetical protein A2303_01410 [Candidatus Falkowbacteria bacterium RIFOXYB2_FULL_47_14]|uniref:Uncharacterized protein n=1 Tax=Candidatus Falkowbacteria bacterium RIFOXYA2_FULL_47_19 TaxID=1797994 RepID=A0A1F5SGW7_9BACT|nr:MAG: hypothetical protein A2227_05705 [Candidatus Falkowbacteria bacterium RIFOXYA2_FULL_47_19]OGF34508.1 MAG: hypothetical protein A2468_04750 [Candidatus Falkowbacteria bacterium RIFOXYC2_FULL_46_15]OGF43546.1 MAG: hypothetical protein A2303_01410 [Candidatus Falkowbacteria bacterium RIFOXYB2_FULL_47_14]
MTEINEPKKEENESWPAGFYPYEEADEEEENKKYPGYRFCSGCDRQDQRIFRSDAGDYIVEVLGEHERALQNGRRVLAQNTVAVLRKGDIDLYPKLRWPEYWWRDGTEASIAIMYLSAMIGMLLFIGGVFAGAWVLWPPSFFPGWILIVAGAFLSAAVIVVGVPILWRFLRIAYGVFCVWFSVWCNIFKYRDRSRSYYRDLFRDLARAGNREKARAAAFMVKFI